MLNRAIDPTNHSLEAAILDQKVAGAFHGKSYAYVSVIRETGQAWGIGIAVEGERGYNPIDGIGFDRHYEAKEFCAGMNLHIGLSEHRMAEIVCSTMRH